MPVVDLVHLRRQPGLHVHAVGPGMRDVIAKDLWDGNASAHAQVIDLKTGKEGAPLNTRCAPPSAHAVAGNAATQVGSLLLTASLSTAVNAVKGLTREEMVECLASPLREPSEFLTAFKVRNSLPGICTTPRRAATTRSPGKPHQALTKPGARRAGKSGGRPHASPSHGHVQAGPQDVL